jgi:hypothetical protein
MSVSAKITNIDVERARKEVQAEKEVNSAMPGCRDVELLVREVFVELVARSGEPANRRDVEESFDAALVVGKVYLERFEQIRALHARIKQQKVRTKVLLS